MPDQPVPPDQPDPFELFGLDPEPQPTPDPEAERAVFRPADPAPSAAAAPRGAADDEDDEYVTLGRGTGRGGGRRWGLVVVGLLVVVLLVVGAGAWWVKGQVDPGGTGEEVALTIPAGSSTSDIASLLADKGIITNATVFEWYLRVKGGGSFQAGDYDGLRTNSSMGDVKEVLEAGPIPPQPVSFLVREGLWESETRQLILDQFPGIDPAALDAALANTHPPLQPAGSSDLEGFLFPATYQVLPAQSADAQALVDQMMTAFGSMAATTGLADASSLLEGEAGKVSIDPYKALIVASMVEAEAKVPEDRAKVARVIYNRLAAGMTLGIDATVLYGLQDRSATLTQQQLDAPSPYNTRKVTGLPPTPINSPGQASVEAALHPADGDWLYYVLCEEDGTHCFSNNITEFNQDVKDARARGIF